MKRAVFLDRDGTLIEEREYLRQPEQVVIYPETGPSLRKLLEAGYLLFIVTNQSGVGRGYFTMEDVRRVNQRVADLLKPEGVEFQKIYVAPEAPEMPSRGRKPSPAFLFDARDEFGIELASSYMIGDKLIDLECGWNAQVKASLLVRTGYGAHFAQLLAETNRPAMVVDNLKEAVASILSRVGLE